MKFVKTLLWIMLLVVVVVVGVDVAGRIIQDGQISKFNRTCHMCGRPTPNIDGLTMGDNWYCTTCVGVIMESERGYGEVNNQ